MLITHWKIVRICINSPPVCGSLTFPIGAHVLGLVAKEFIHAAHCEKRSQKL